MAKKDGSKAHRKGGARHDTLLERVQGLRRVVDALAQRLKDAEAQLVAVATAAPAQGDDGATIGPRPAPATTRGRTAGSTTRTTAPRRGPSAGSTPRPTGVRPGATTVPKGGAGAGPKPRRTGARHAGAPARATRTASRGSGAAPRGGGPTTRPARA